ncbi:MAG TPA: hypothetical protein VI408_09325 [Gaiellaceae bacterium]
MRPATSGAVAALVWAAVEPIDKRVFRHDYSDVEMLGKLVTRSRAWPVAGLAVHAANGAAFGAAAARLRIRPLHLALVENVALYPLSYFVDRRHPARGELAPLLSWRGFAQATFRHALFGLAVEKLQ